jgi:hypothetical protein
MWRNNSRLVLRVEPSFPLPNTFLDMLIDRPNFQHKSWAPSQKVWPCRHPCHTWDLELGTPCEVVCPNFHTLNGWDCKDGPLKWLGSGTPMWTNPKGGFTLGFRFKKLGIQNMTPLMDLHFWSFLKGEWEVRAWDCRTLTGIYKPRNGPNKVAN